MKRIVSMILLLAMVFALALSATSCNFGKKNNQAADFVMPEGGYDGS